MVGNSPQTNGNGGNYVRAEEPNAVATDPSLAALHFMQLQAALQGIEQFDGKEPPLRTRVGFSKQRTRLLNSYAKLLPLPD